MAIFAMLVMFAFAVITALSGTMTDSMLENEESRLDKVQNGSKVDKGFRTQILRKFDYLIKNFKPNDILNCCELPIDENIISTVIGLKLHKNPKYVQKDFHVNFRCTDPGSFELLGGPKNVRCNGLNSDQTVNQYCVQAKNETEWQDDMLQIDSDRKQCCGGVSSPYEVFTDPLSPDDYFQCLGNKFVLKGCRYSYNGYFDNNVKSCKSGLGTNNHISARYKPSIIVDASNSVWDSMGWLLVEKGSNVTLDCIYPRVEGKTDVNWYKTDYEIPASNNYGDAQNASQVWISDYRTRIVLQEVDYTDTGFYTCKVAYYREYVMPYVTRYPQIYSRSVTIALKEKGCHEIPLPDFKLHQRYYRKFPVMNRVKRWCQRNREMGSSQMETNTIV